jgi:hypothetical protein
MKYLLIAVGLIFVAIGHALALGPHNDAVQEYYSQMASGKCWGPCAYLSSIAECISCGLSYHGVGHQRAVIYYCQKLQPKCGR